MSGICGLFYLDAKPVQAEVDRMLASLAHRGPDRSGTWQSGPVGLGNCLLWTTPESLLERLPATDPGGEIVLTADARIDNRDELISALSLRDGSYNRLTDSQLILAAYEKWGENCPYHLIGDFAFALWDGYKKQFFCARDHLGFKSFYFYWSSQIFAFASEIKALLSLPELPRRLNEVRIADHLVGFFEDRTSTFYVDIHRLPPAHWMRVSPTSLQVQRYWCFDPTKEIRLSSDSEYAEAFLEEFAQAVRCRLRSAYPVGCALSGGLDSSSIACTARNLQGEQAGQPLHTFSALFPGLSGGDLQKIDERGYIEEVLSSGRFEAHTVEADKVSPLVDLDRALWHHDEPFLAANYAIHWSMHRAAHSQGVRVFLDGLDGDTTVSHGLGYLTDLARSGRWLELIKNVRALSRNGQSGFRTRQALWQYGIQPLVPAFIYAARRRLTRDKAPAWMDHSVINPGFAGRIGLQQRYQSVEVGRFRAARTFRENQLQSFEAGLLQTALESLDKVTAAFQLEARYPFFDRRLMVFCLALPPSQRLASGWTRLIQRRAMEGILPPGIQWRTSKANLSPNLLHGLLEFNKPNIDQLLSANPQKIEPYLDLARLQEVCRTYLSQPHTSQKEALALFGAIILANWLRDSAISA